MVRGVKTQLRPRHYQNKKAETKANELFKYIYLSVLAQHLGNHTTLHSHGHRRVMNTDLYWK